jgi:hypothetical protein
MRPFVRHCLLTAALACVANSGLAQAPSDAAAALPAPLRKYRVEFIVFAHTDFDAGEELFDTGAGAGPPDVPPASELPFGAESPGAGAPRQAAPGAPAADGLEPIYPHPAGAASTVDSPFWFRVLRADELELAGTYARLENLRAYTLLAHGGWIQEGLDETAARSMDLANLGIVNPSGSLRLHVSRFLHLGVDLELRAQAPGAENPVDAAPSALAEITPWSTRYRMVEQRRARSGELHYVDHPRFGLLFMISPVPEEVEEVPDDTGVLTPAV